jgi:hypothetical protein
MKSLLVLMAILFASSSFAQNGIGFPKGMPICRNNKGDKIQNFDNQKVIKLKVTTPNLYKEQVLVKVNLVSFEGIVSNKHGKHLHFNVGLADGIDDLSHENIIEISASVNGYTSPTASDLVGPIYICGEYSTTDVNKKPKITNFEPSPTGAMIHWTHLANPDINSIPKHPHGWIFANGKLFGTYR